MTSPIRTLMVLVFLSGMLRAQAQEHSFPRDFAPTDDYTKPQERPFRDDVCLNGSWQFMPVEGADKLTKDQLTYPDVPTDPSWEKTPVKVPSPWNINSFASGDRGGDFVTYPSYPKRWESVRAGWLRRDLPYRKEWNGKRLILHFTAVAGFTKVFVNGKMVGQNFDVFLPFDIDITDQMRKDGKNELLLWVADANLFNEPGKFGRRIYVGGSFWGQHIRGIWQDVYLQARPGVYVQSMAIRPFVSKDELEVEATVRNETDAVKRVRVSASVSPWINEAGSAVTEAPEPKWKLGEPVLTLQGPEIELAPHSEQKVTFSAQVQGRLRLWSPSDPNLYGMVTSVSGLDASASGLDRKYDRFGWREGRIIGDKFYLNGSQMVLKGDSWHFMGIPQMTRRYAWAWFTMLKDAHANAVRLHAEPYPSFYLDVADELGIMVLDETGMWASDGGPKEDAAAYWANAEDHLRRFILRDRNHPSVFGWSVCNENEPVVIHVQHAPDTLIQRQLDEINRWVATAREMDPSREWISGDGETDRKTDLPVIIGHYGGDEAFKNWSTQGRLWGIGESGMAYYGTPRQSSVYNGEASYVSQYGRMEGVADEATHIINQQKRYKASYQAVFNLVWYGLKPLEFGLDDTTRAPRPSDGVFFPPFREGRGGVQPERLGPYTSTLNPGYDPRLPLYRTWPLFDAIQASFGDTALLAEAPAPPAHPVAKAGTGTVSVTLLSADRESALAKTLSDIGVSFNEGAKPSTQKSAYGSDAPVRLLILDGAHPPTDDASIALVRSVSASDGHVLVWGVLPSTQDILNRYLPAPVTITDRKASSFIVGAYGDPMIDGLTNADFYFSEISRQPVAEYGLSGDFVRDGKILVDDCNTDWKSWNNQAEYRKTISVLRSEREAKPQGAALVVLGEVYCFTLDPVLLNQASGLLAIQLLKNMGASFTDAGAAHLPALDAYGVLRNYDTLKGGISFWVYSPRSLTDLLAEPDLPRLDLQLDTKSDYRILLNDKPVNRQNLPLERGWNHFIIMINGFDKEQTNIKFNCNRKEFIQEIRSRVRQ